jgi:hypothetical protein
MIHLAGFNERFLHGSPACAHQGNSFDPGRSGGHQIGKSVTNHQGIFQIEGERSSRLKEQSWEWFPAVAKILWSMRAHEYPVDPAAGSFDFMDEAIVNLYSCLKWDNPPTDRRLVGHQDNLEEAVADPGKCGKGLWKDVNFRPGSHVIRSVFNNHAVSIQEDSRMHPENYTLHG